MGYLKVLLVLALAGCGGMIALPIPASSVAITCLPKGHAIGERVWVAEHVRYATIKDFPIDDTQRCEKRGVMAAVELDAKRGLESSVTGDMDLLK